MLRTYEQSTFAQPSIAMQGRYTLQPWNEVANSAYLQHPAPQVDTSVIHTAPICATCTGHVMATSAESSSDIVLKKVYVLANAPFGTLSKPPLSSGRNAHDGMIMITSTLPSSGLHTTFCAG